MTVLNIFLSLIYFYFTCTSVSLTLTATGSHSLPERIPFENFLVSLLRTRDKRQAARPREEWPDPPRLDPYIASSPCTPNTVHTQRARRQVRCRGEALATRGVWGWTSHMAERSCPSDRGWLQPGDPRPGPTCCTGDQTSPSFRVSFQAIWCHPLAYGFTSTMKSSA